MDVLLNESEFDSFYLQSLNACFRKWGDETMFDWVFKRQCGSFQSDRMIVLVDGVPIGGSGVTYREVRLKNGAIVPVGIMTGSWTLPPARGKGVFGRIIEESRELCLRKGCGFLLAFVTHDNPSRRALERSGAGMFPTWYVFGEVNARESQEYSWNKESYTPAPPHALTHFHYSTTEAFLGQFLERPSKTSILSVPSGNAIIESTPTMERILCISSRTNRSETLNEVTGVVCREGKKAFYFSSCEASPFQLESKQGYLALLSANLDVLEKSFGHSSVPVDSRCFADPNSAVFVGPWFIEAGDRM